MIKLPILTTSLMEFSLKGWKNVLLALGNKRVNAIVILFMLPLGEYMPVVFTVEYRGML